MFKKGLAYEAVIPINWCPSCLTGLANEEVVAGKCDRCHTAVEKKDMKQWMLKITAYADRLLNGLEKLDWPESIKSLQRNWIGRSVGARVKFTVQLENKEDFNYQLEIFTTRPDTLFGATFMVLAPEHELVNKVSDSIANIKEVNAYIDQAKNKSDLERTDLNKEKTGIQLQGCYAINPVNNEKLPIWLADYVLANYGTGAIMSVPAHDQRDWEFAKKYNLPIIKVVDNNLLDGAFIEEGVAVNSGEFNGLSTAEFKKQIIQWLMDRKLGQEAVNYKLRDWVFSRQRYWGEPIPLVHCQQCGIVAVPDEQLPVTLPVVDKYEPTGTGESPLVAITDWVNTKCPVCGQSAKRETNTMPQWAGSSWYWLRFIDPHNHDDFADQEKLQYWLPVDTYVGGAEHAVLHLLYARFWNMVLFDLGLVPVEEPFQKLINQGMILGPDGEKMSKSRGNVINPDEIVREYGADTLRLYEMFMGPLEDAKPWDTKSIVGVRRFLDRVYNIQIVTESSEQVVRSLHKLIKKVGEDIENFRFNTAISAMMIFLNDCHDQLSEELLQKFLVILSPFAPHLAEELWSKTSDNASIFLQQWPAYDSTLVIDEQFELVIQINGKVRDTILVQKDITQDEIEELIGKSEQVQKYLAGQKPKKIIYIKGRLVSIVI